MAHIELPPLNQLYLRRVNGQFASPIYIFRNHDWQLRTLSTRDGKNHFIVPFVIGTGGSVPPILSDITLGKLGFEPALVRGQDDKDFPLVLDLPSGEVFPSREWDLYRGRQYNDDERANLIGGPLARVIGACDAHVRGRQCGRSVDDVAASILDTFPHLKLDRECVVDELQSMMACFSDLDAKPLCPLPWTSQRLPIPPGIVFVDDAPRAEGVE